MPKEEKEGKDENAAGSSSPGARAPGGGQDAVHMGCAAVSCAVSCWALPRTLALLERNRGRWAAKPGEKGLGRSLAAMLPPALPPLLQDGVFGDTHGLGLAPRPGVPGSSCGERKPPLLALPPKMLPPLGSGEAATNRRLADSSAAEASARFIVARPSEDCERLETSDGCSLRCSSSCCRGCIGGCRAAATAASAAAMTPEVDAPLRWRVLATLPRRTLLPALVRRPARAAPRVPRPEPLPLPPLERLG